jgi:outer membrane biosynthesis protein TonB
MADTTETKPAEGAETEITMTEQTAETKPAEPQPAAETKPATETKPTETTKPAEETKPAEPDYKAEAESYAARAIQAEARSALSGLGVPAARLDAALKVADLAGIDLKDAKAGEKIAAAAAKVLELVPEFKGGAGTGSTVSTPRKPGTLDDFQRGYMGAK